MKTNLIQKLALGLAGTTATSIGLMIASVPHVFYESYGITLGSDPNLLSELRGPGAAFALLGFVMILGAMQRDLTKGAVLIAVTVFTAFPVGRLISIVADGLPNASILGALMIEVALLAMLLAAFIIGRHRNSPAPITE
ncbi:MAG: DUF4345 domain-containing protein [Pseudomonadota bacterium]